MDICLSPYFYFILAFIVFVVEGQPGGTTTFLDLFDGNFVIPGGINNVPTANFDDPNLPVEFLQFINLIPNTLEEVVPVRCQAPVEEGTCSGRSLRWAYDVEFRRCRPFFFTGCNGNQNNFPSRLSCQISCPTSCDQNIDVGSCNQNLTRWGYNDFTGRCQAFTFGGCGGNTNNFVSERDCVETCGDVCLLPILRGPCDGQLPRWGYNFFTGQCQQFFYGGCEGNRNNFISQEICELACVSEAFPECPAIDPTLINVGPFGIGCIGGTPQIPCPPEGCQEGFACCENGCGSVCVQLENPPPPSPCSQTITVGTCNDAIPRFGFDAAMGTCQLFTYTGCGGNENNFQTFSECIAACVPDICNEPVERGPCTQNIFRWAYDPVAMTCTVFSYGGCGGNENNFVSPSECFTTCFRGLPEVDVCQQPIDAGLCGGNVARFAFDIDVGFCLPLTYGGCGGNDNNFATLLECDARCPPSIPESVCLFPIEVGPCLNVIQSWGFDNVAGECVQFNYGGCDGNGNRFLTQTTCELRCLGQAQNLCPDGNPPCLVDPCTTATCPGDPAALCTSDLCDVNRQCLAVFVSNVGIPVNCDVVINLCAEPIVRGPCFGYLPRWGYNPVTNQCEVFIFSGCFGNQNNFDSYVACSERCIGVTNVDVCAQPIQVGTCSNFIAAWAFNAQTGDCESFSYSGCGGNGNSFSTRDECISTCEPFEVCALPVDVGPCITPVQRFAFNSNTGQCEPFMFGGCLGNGNNFLTQLECAQRCVAVDLPVCDQVISAGPCIGQLASWGFNSDSGQCEFFLASLCPDSENRFQSFADCAQQCNAPADRCQPSIQAGGCTDSIERWGYNSATQQCQLFLYSGCMGNGNSFDTSAECQQTCDVTVNSNPVITSCPAIETITVVPGGTTERQFFYTPPICNDAEDGVRPVTCIPATGLVVSTAINSITCTCSDTQGVPASCTTSNIVTVNSNPVITSCPAVETITVVPGGTTERQFFYTPPICNDAEDGVRPVTCTPASGLVVSTAINSITCTCSDTQGVPASCTTSNIVTVNSNPVITSCPAVETIIVVPVGTTERQFFYTPPTCNDAEDGVRPVTCTPASGFIVSTAINSITCTCSDTQGIPASCTTSNIVTVNSNPVITSCPAVGSITVLPVGGTERQFFYTPPTCNDAEDGARTVTCTPASGLVVSTTVNSITCTCSDTQGIPASCTTSNIVTVNSNPVITSCPAVGAITVVPGGTTERQFFYTPPTCNDAEDGVRPVTCTPASGLVVSTAVNSITCTCSDTQGVPASCTTSNIDGVDPCSEAIDGGPCTDFAVRFAYNSVTESCQSFFFGGCQGNGNNFALLDECNLRCVTDVCAQPIVNCPGTDERWGYDPAQGMCVSFPFDTAQCTSNGNFFLSQADCQQRCEAPVCNQAIATGFCSSSLLRFGYDLQTGQCQQFTYSGCGGTANRFNTLAECQQNCEADTCAQPLAAGPCSENQLRFRFNPLTALCDIFNYGGCLGNSNLFVSGTDCILRCNVDLCTLPLDPGPCNSFSGVFGYNPDTGQCESFTYGGCQGNPNRFTLMSQCQARCEVNICSQPEDAGPCSSPTQRFSFNVAAGACQPFTFGGCLGGGNSFATNEICEANCGQTVDGNNPCSQIIDSGPCTDNTIRFAYNAVTGSCEALVFGGCGGTTNNFLTMDACNQRCVTDVCAQPVISCAGTETGFSYDPAQGICVSVTIGNGCTANGNFFASQNVCQQRCEVPVCSQAIVGGSCPGSLTRFGYDSFTGQCQQYTYSGCDGTANRFTTLAECQQTCEADPCAQPLTPGPCSEIQTRVGFNLLTAACETFTYGGCLGNDNMFQSVADCQLQCSTSVCSQAISAGTCSLSLGRFAFNAQTGQCQQFTYSGCGGTSNRFYTLAACQQRCEVDTCGLPIVPGPCTSSIPRFGFNTVTGQCESFNYGGCLGNENLFQTAAACQNRCLVNLCSLPLDTGSCSANIEQWWFNPATGFCQSFTYGGCLGNANRFAQETDCQARCEANICSQPVDPGPCSAGLPSISYNSNSNTCEQFTFGGCLGGGNRFDTFAQCQTSCVGDNIGEVCSKPVDPGSCSDGLSRFFYNSVTESCQGFVYGGCAGNSNNFMTLDACNQRCVTDVCAQPLPNCPGALTRWGYDPNQGACVSFTYDSCQNSANLFASQADCQQRCEAPVCSQATDVGICSNQLPRFSFDPSTLQCQQFGYTGCGGTANRFNTLQECQDYCEVDICAQTVDAGPCSIPQLRFGFNSATAQCETFTYMGCLGSANRFETISACTERCQVDLCSLPLEIGSCNFFSQPWGFDRVSGSCQQFTYGGCLGNANRFSTEAACQDRCAVNVCSQAEDPGPCSASITAFSYNPGTGTCGQFIYGGCLGGGNRFDSLTLCQATCEVPVGDPCSQIIDDGLCADSFPRFAYNAQTLICESFQYTGCGGNSNNFLTADACSQRCVDDVCAQPMAQCAGINTRWSYNPATGTCQSSLRGDCRSQTGNFFETEAECQQRCQAPICSQAIDAGTCTGQSTMFAFNTNTGQCQTLIYTGCGGNANRFSTFLECQQHCEVDVCGRPRENGPCSAGLSRFAFNDASGQCVSLTYGGCLGSSNRFATAAECQQRCLVDVCALPMEVGSCTQTNTMWWFNQATGACEQFVYTGCEGNANRFVSQTACIQRCIDEVCVQPLDVGVCQGAIPRIRFNSLTGQCDQYTYTGCFGSANSFPTTAACQARCNVQLCSLSLDTGPCSGTDLFWGHNPASSTCQQFAYGGCLGNPNRFSTLADCQARCQVENICTEGRDPGPCTAFTEQYFFNPANSQCDPFLYGGCLGGNNRFQTQAACEAMCQVGFPASCPVPTQDGNLCGFLFCLTDDHCQVAGQLCCPNGCSVGMECIEAVFVNVKAGNCPAVPAQDPAQCGDNSCTQDDDCNLLMKCCYTGCGTQCMDPV